MNPALHAYIPKKKPYRCQAFYVKPPKPDDRGIRFEGRRYSVRLRGGRKLPAIFGTRADARAARDAVLSDQTHTTILTLDRPRKLGA